MALWRREFLGLGLGMAALGGGGAGAAPATLPPVHPKDAWLDQGGQRHRIIFDTVSAKGAGEALNFADNFYLSNRCDYDVPGKDLSVVIILRSSSVSFGFNDTAWQKFGPFLSDWGGLGETEREKSRAAWAEYVLSGGMTKGHATVNPYNTNPVDPKLYSNGRRLSGVTKEGARFALCEVAARNVASIASEATGMDARAIMNELAANMIPNAVMVPSGIVTLSRAQERGYTLCSCG